MVMEERGERGGRGEREGRGGREERGEREGGAWCQSDSSRNWNQLLQSFLPVFPVAPLSPSLLSEAPG